MGDEEETKPSPPPKPGKSNAGVQSRPRRPSTSRRPSIQPDRDRRDSEEPRRESQRHVVLDDDRTMYVPPESTTDAEPTATPTTAPPPSTSGFARLFLRRKTATMSSRHPQEPTAQARQEMRTKGSRILYTTDEEVREALMEFAVFIAFLVLTCLVTLSVRHSYMFYFNDTMQRLFTTRDLIIQPSVTSCFEKILTVPDFWDYMIYNYLVTLHGDLTNGTVTTTVGGRTTLEGKVFLHENLLLGPPRMRQLRVRSDSCYVNDAFVRYFNTCYAAYSSSAEDIRKSHKGSLYKTSEELESRRVITKLNSYSSGGYVVDLTYDKEHNLEIIKKLRDNQWLDRGSRICIVEFNLYNENTDIFQSSKFIAEIPPTGGVLPQVIVKTMKYYSFFTDKSLAMTTVFIFWYVMVVYYNVYEILAMRKSGWKYLKSIVNILDLTILTICYLALAYNIWHALHVSKLVRKLKTLKNHISLDTLDLMNSIYVDLMAILSFLVWMKIFKFISFNKTLVQFTTTLRRCAKDLAGFSLMFGIVFLAYAQLGLLLFGTKHPDFREFLTSLLTMIRMILGDFQYNLIEEANRWLGPIYFLTYILLVFFILLNMFLAIIMETYNTVKSEITQGRSQLGSYVFKKLKAIYFFIRYCGRRKRPVRVVHEQEQLEENIQDDSKQEEEKEMNFRRNMTAADAHYFEDVPAEVRNKDLYRLTNRVALLEEILEQLVNNMDAILKRVESEIKKNN